MNKFEMRTHNKKETIIKMALLLFSQEGYSNVNIETIAAKANVSKVSLFKYFGNKEGLLEHCIDYTMSEMIEKAHVILNESISFREKFLKAITLCQHEVNSDLEAIVSAEMTKKSKYITLIVTKIIKQKNQIYEDFIDYGIATQAIKPNISKQAILSVLAAINASSDITEADLPSITILILEGILSTQ